MAESERQKEKEEIKIKIRQRYKGVDKEELDLLPALPTENLFESAATKRVCAYCRVSTGDVNQTSSYELQKNHYEDMIREHPGWELVEIYADEGISGTSLEHRDEFNRMIRDCHAGLIDLVVTKSVSRFSRNVVDCIKTVRELASLKSPVGVLFEAEHIYSLNQTSEMMLGVLAMGAQEESRTKSEVMNMSIEHRFSRGIFLTPSLLGYDWKKFEKELVLNEEEAETVKLCYYLFIGGYSAKDIAKLLMSLGCKTKTGSTKWTANTVLGVIRNERHCGMVISHKTYTPNYLNHKARPNKRNRNQWSQRNHHDAIVSEEVYNAAMELIQGHKHIKANRPLPTMQVIPSGVLKGYIPVDRNWHGFSYEKYKCVSDSINSMGEKHIKYVTGAAFGGAPKGFKTASQLMFSTFERPMMRLSAGKIEFNVDCIKKLNTEYIELLLNIQDRRIAVRPCSNAVPGAVNWGVFADGKWKPKPRSCTGLMMSLIAMMGWNPSSTYKIQGQLCKAGSARVMIFELDEAMIIKKDGRKKKMEWLINYAEKLKKEPDAQYLKKYPKKWEQEILQPAVTVEALDIKMPPSKEGEEKRNFNYLSEEEIQRLLIEAEIIMERMREKNEAGI